MYKRQAPKGVKITIVNVEDAVKRQQEGAFDKNRVMVLFKGVAELNAAVQALSLIHIFIHREKQIS